MKKLIIALSGCAWLTSCVMHNGAPQTVITDPSAARKLEGAHDFSLQWISWDDFGRVDVTNEHGTWKIGGRQDSKTDGDFVSIEGVITEIQPFEFTFEGDIVTQVSHIAGGQPVTRSGKMTFRITGTRQYWRLVEMQNPSDSVVDYIDIYFRRP